jgi:hypothetical protein
VHFESKVAQPFLAVRLTLPREITVTERRAYLGRRLYSAKLRSGQAGMLPSKNYIDGYISLRYTDFVQNYASPPRDFPKPKI